MADEPQPSAMRFPLAVRRPIEPGPWPNDNVRAELGEAIRGLRRYHLLTQRELEEVTGIDQTVISRLEGGRHVHIRLSRLLALLGAMGVVRISFRSRYTGASVAAWMSRTSDVAHSDVMRPPVERRRFPGADEPSELEPGYDACHHSDDDDGYHDG